MNNIIFPNDAAMRYSQLPDDFPRPDIASAVAGYQAKLALVEYEGRLYVSGGTPPELFARWEVCEDLAQHLAVKSRESKVGKCSHLSETEILDQYCDRLLKTDWGSDAEMKWVIRRAAELIGWPVPVTAITQEERT